MKSIILVLSNQKVVSISERL